MAIVGIDLGTTYSVVALPQPAGARVLADAAGRVLLPSLVGLAATGEWRVGHAAAPLLLEAPERVVRSVKRRMGTGQKVRLGDEEFSPASISARLLVALRQIAEQALGEPVTEAVVSVPAYFHERARHETLQAAELAGLPVRRLIAEPTAAALAYGFGRAQGERVLVCDLGGGTFDLSLLEFHDGLFEVVATTGDTRLGGDDWTTILAELLAQRAGLARSPCLWQIAEHGKRLLSGAAQLTLDLRPVGGPAEMKITAADYEAACAPLLERLLAPAQLLWRDTGLGRSDGPALDALLLVGGSSRLPMVQRALADFFGQPGVLALDPDLAVGQGAALYAGLLSHDLAGALLLDITPLSLGLETKGGGYGVILPRHTRLPATRERIVTTATDGQEEMEIHLLQGEGETAASNTSLGRFLLQGIPPAPAGAARVAVEFTLDLNGILIVRAEELLTGTSAELTVCALFDPPAPPPADWGDAAATTATATPAGGAPTATSATTAALPTLGPLPTVTPALSLTSRPAAL